MTETLTSTNPATLEANGDVPVDEPKDVEAAIRTARDARPAWASRGLDERLDLLDRFRRRLVEQAEDVARTVTRETGKPLGEAVAADVYPVVDAVAFVRSRAPDVLETRVDLDNPMAKGRTSRIVREPVGVVGHITPWNYPFGIPGSQVVYSLAAGNAVVVKPASRTPLTGQRVGDLLVEAGLPEDVVQVVQGPGSTTGRAVAEGDVDRLQFTGSREVGWALHESAAARGVPACLELGGSDPAVVLDDADVDLAADGIVWSRFANAGQTCAAVKRVLADEAIADDLTDRIVAKVDRLRVGDPLAETVDVGPLIDADAVETIRDQVDRSLDAGAELLAGGAPLDRTGHFFEPTVLGDVTPEMPVMQEETFGPVLPIRAVDDAEDGVAQANATEFGLTASVWTEDVRRGRRLAGRLQAGTVTVNEHTYTYALNATPWSGRKTSGLGATHGIEGLEAVTTAKHVHVAGGRRDLWWFPYADDQTELMLDGLDVIYGDKLMDRLRKAPRMLKRMRSKEGL